MFLIPFSLARKPQLLGLLCVRGLIQYDESYEHCYAFLFAPLSKWNRLHETFVLSNEKTKVFYSIGNCSNQPRRFALFGYKENHDRRATISGDSPLFYFEADGMNLALSVDKTEIRSFDCVLTRFAQDDSAVE